MRISARAQDLTRIEAEVLVAPLWSDERPPHGLAGRADWYLCGYLSRLILAGRLRGTPEETTLVALQGRLLAPRLLLLGLGPRRPLEGGPYGDLLRRAAGAVRDLGLAQVAVELPPAPPGTGPRGLLAELTAAFGPVLGVGDPALDGELVVLAGSEEECESWRRAIRESYPRGQVHALPRGARVRVPLPSD